MKLKKKHIPNIITAIRIIGTACLLFLTPLSPAFYIIYTISGISDVADGWTARKLGVTSEFGAKLDSCADLLYYAVMVFKVFPILWDVLPVWIWITVGATVVLRILSYTLGAVKFRCFVSVHSYMNKMTSAVAFFIPYILRTSWIVILCGICAVVMILAAVEELIMHIYMKEYDPKVKSLMFCKMKN